MNRLRRALARDERGASLIMVAGAMVLLLGAAAVAIDLAALRYDMRADRLASDAASVAGASAIEPFSGSNAEEGCDIAWRYVLINLEDEGTPTDEPNCETFDTACSPDDARIVTGTAPPYTIEIVHPVPDDYEMPDGYPIMGTQSVNEDVDGVACQRLGVRIQRQRDFTFAAGIGFDTGTTDVSSVGRIRPDVGEGDVVPLVVLEPHDCGALTADGQGKVTVTHFEDSPGVIAVDSDGSGACGASQPYIIDVKANGNKRWIRALPVPGEDGAQSAILSYALWGDGTHPEHAYNPDDLVTGLDTGTVDPSDPDESKYQLYPKPIRRSQPVTRSVIDHRYDCKLSYPLYLGIEMDPCTDDEGDNYIEQHHDLYGEPAGSPPPGLFTRWTDIDADEDCQVGSDEEYDVTDNVWVDCDDTLEINGGTVRFDNVNAVFDGGLELKSDGVFEMNAGVDDDHWAFFREGGNITKVAQASILFKRTSVYLEDGFVDLVGGSGGLEWTAPTDEDYRFEDLALWSESSAAHELGGQAGNTLTGTFFTPYADPFILKGQSGQLQTAAQFFTRKLEVDGFTEVLMEPDPTTSTLVPIRGVSLIR